MKDPLVRQALDLAFDFEWTNRNLFHNLYTRTESYFENSDMKAKASLRRRSGSFSKISARRWRRGRWVRRSCRPRPTAPALSATSCKKLGGCSIEAGWTIKNGARVNDKGERLKVEILNFEPAFERVHAPYVKNLQLLGIDATMRMVDPAQYQRRLKSFDFDVTTQRYVMRNTPGVELRSYFGSDAAKMDGSLNLAGISDPAVDALVEEVIEAKSREELETAASALDRVLRAGHYWVPHWYKASHNIAYWDKFSRPDTKPRFDRGVLDTWWYDGDKAAKLELAAASTAREEEPEEPGSRSPLGIIFAVLAGLALAGYFFFRHRRRNT